MITKESFRTGKDNRGESFHLATVKRMESLIPFVYTPLRLSRYGDDMTGNTGSLCVRRATYWDPALKADDPAKKGICSNFLCDTQPGDEVEMTGPAGKVMLLPEEDPKTDYIMVATGTGIAPYRGFIRRLFVEDTPAAEAYKGQAWLFLGVANKDALLYDDEFQDVKTNHPDQFRLALCPISRGNERGWR